nr:unnamed protein product [Spirometra erinaceieuropaei]
MLRHAVSAPRSIAVAVLDVAKAFDSVNHDTLLRAAVAHGAPPLLLNLLSSSYSRTTTHVFDTELRCLRGVRQAISYSDQQLGFELDGVTVDCIAYADDLVLFAESPHRLQQRLDGLANGLSLAGMVLNSAKTRCQDRVKKTGDGGWLARILALALHSASPGPHNNNQDFNQHNRHLEASATEAAPGRAANTWL